MAEENKESLLRRTLGMLHDNVRIYQIAEDREVQRDEFQYCQVMYQVLFGDKGFAETLGPTWNMIHDPRFNVIENMLVINRQAIFGGDARVGRQYFGDDGVMNSTVSDLDKYAEILGEGRHYHNVLVHPDVNCEQRLWLERIQKGFTNIKPYDGFVCTCKGRATSAKTFKDAPDDDIWALIKQESPNRAFSQTGLPTAYGKTFFNLIKADMLGLISDYSETPLIDSYVYLRDHGVVTETESVATIDPHGQDAPRVLQEVDLLEQALTHRAVLRVTAYKVLRKFGFEKEMAARVGEDFELTDFERDQILTIIYRSDYPEGDYRDVFFRAKLDKWEKDIKVKVLDYIDALAMTPFADRERSDLDMLKAMSEDTMQGLMDGSILPINHYTEPTAEIPVDERESEVMQYARIVEELQKNEFKWELYLILVEAEQQKDTAIVDVLSPVFMTPDYPLDEQGFYQILERLRIGSKSLRAERMDAIRGVKQVKDKKTGIVETEGEFHSKDNPGGMFRS